MDRAKPASKTSCTITRATLRDLHTLAPLFDAYRVFYRRPSDPAAARTFLHARIENRESVIFLARDGAGTAVGFVQLYPCFSSISAQRVWILNDLYVSERARRQGVARTLMEAAHAHARQTGAIRMTLSTAHDNTEAQALYESLGYLRDTAMLDYALDLDGQPVVGRKP